ncbi:MAG: class I SAM-dependent methyltransferase [Candidatus Bathyarchaeota archaeon]|nr:class I SAM-dependent methyltransferase [Candidatus Bathyarchaeota archaeon]
MVCHGGFSLDEKKRRSWYDPEAILKDVGLAEGMTFVDMGCADGFFTLLASKVVGAEGKVYAVDIDAKAIEKLKRKLVEQGVGNVEAKVAKAEETVFCKGKADVVFFSMVLHDFHDPVQVLCNAKSMLKPEGTLANLDWKKEDTSFGPPEHIRFSTQHASELMAKANLKVQTSKDVGPHHYLITAKPAKQTC